MWHWSKMEERDVLVMWCVMYKVSLNELYIGIKCSTPHCLCPVISHKLYFVLFHTSQFTVLYPHFGLPRDWWADPHSPCSMLEVTSTSCDASSGGCSGSAGCSRRRPIGNSNTQNPNTKTFTFIFRNLVFSKWSWRSWKAWSDIYISFLGTYQLFH